MQNEISKESNEPLYLQLINIIKDQIANGQLNANDRIMTELELGDTYNISRSTVRKALEFLEEEGILIKRQGRGTFVAEKKLNRDVRRFQGFTEACESNGQNASAELLCADLIDANPHDIQNLKLQENDKIIRIVRLRKCDGAPVIIEGNHFPTQYSFLLGEDLTCSIFDALRRKGINPCKAIKKIEICYATDFEAKHLQVEQGSALIVLKDIIWDKDKNPILVCKSIINPERYSLTILSEGSI